LQSSSGRAVAPTSKQKDLFHGGRQRLGFSKPIMPAMRINLVQIRHGQTTARSLQRFLPRIMLRERFYHRLQDFDPFFRIGVIAFSL